MFKSKKAKAEADELKVRNAETGNENEDSSEDEDNASPEEKEENYLQALEEQPEWIDQEEEEGQLSVDVYEEGDKIIVKSTIAGVEPEDLDIAINNDMLTIRGDRKQKKEMNGRNYFFQECYWGAFSRSIILPVDVDVKKIDATIQNGILTVILPKTTAGKSQKSIKVKDKN